jgi:hypothetical protein
MSLRFGLIGYGLWGRHHARAIVQAPGATLTAIACRTEDTAAAAARDFPDVRVHRDYRELLARGDVDAVDVVVPNALHAEVGVAALEAGKDVLLEKPLAPTLEGCDRLITAAARTGRVLTIGHELRLSHQWGGIKRLIDAGDLGDVTAAVMTLFRFPYRPGSGGWRYEAGQASTSARSRRTSQSVATNGRRTRRSIGNWNSFGGRCVSPTTDSSSRASRRFADCQRTTPDKDSLRGRISKSSSLPCRTTCVTSPGSLTSRAGGRERSSP